MKTSALLQFKKAYEELLGAFCEDNTLNELESIALYPFGRSFDEYNVSEWVDEAVKELKEQA